MFSEVDVIIPALNEEASLPLVLRDLPAVRNIFVVDNGSTDATERVAAEHGATVVCELQRGYGAACLRGLAAIEMQIKAARANLRYCEIPVPYRRRVGSSKISGTVGGTIRAGSKILYSLARYGFNRSRSDSSRPGERPSSNQALV